MSLIVPQAGQLDVLTALISGALNGCKMRLFASNLTLGPSTTLATLLAAEATFTGYAAATLNSWSTPATDGSGAAASTDSQGQFTPTGSGGSGNVYGYFLTDSGGTKLFGCESFGSAMSVAQNVTLTVTCTYTDITRF
jgi:hypothetical protein